MRKDLAVALSLANLCLVGIWAELLPFLYLSESYPIGAFPCSRDFGAAMLNLVLLALVLFLGGRLLRRPGHGRLSEPARWLFLAVLLVPLNATRTHFNTYPERWWEALGWPYAPVIFGAVAIAAAVWIWRRREAATRSIAVGLLVMLPFAFITMAQAAWGAASDRACRAEALSAPKMAPASDTRIVWIVFDEIEQRATFEERPAGLVLPEFDRFRRESIYAADVEAPGHQTELSMPAYISGLMVSQAFVTGHNALMVKFAGAREARKWGSEPDIFSKARDRGLNTALSGWFLPYCAALASHLTECHWQPCTTCGRRVGAFGKTLVESMWYQLAEMAPRYGRRRHIAAYRSILDHALRLAGDRSLGLLLLHFPVPHDPWIFDRASGSLTMWHRSADGYFDNLALADRTLGQVRQTFERAGLWERATVVVTGDHGWRVPDQFGGRVDRRVPFLVKMPGQRGAIAVTSAFNAILAHDLTLAILDHQVADAAQAAAWLTLRSKRPGGSGSSNN